jgi:hypothetical protein
MSLLSIDLTKKKRLSLQGVELRAPKPRIEATPTLVDQRPPTEEEIAYSKLVAKYPLIEKLVNRVGLVSDKTGDRLRIVKLPEERMAIDNSKLIDLAHRILQGERSYNRAEIVDQIEGATEVTKDRAERGFNLLLQARAIEPTLDPGLYYLYGSTPF